ncbi:RAB guanine nucleotide exchange factor (GEF) 1, variant 2 [Balamuthia mandrillaris]
MRNNEEEEESHPPPLPPLSQQNEEGEQEEDKTKVYEEDNKEGEDKEEEEANCNNNNEDSNESTSAPIPIARASFSSPSSSSAEDPLSHSQNTSTTIGGGGEGASPSTSPWRRWLPFQFAAQTPPPPPPPPPPLPQSLSSSSSSSPLLTSASPSLSSSATSASASASSSAVTSAFYYSPLIPLPSPYAALSTSSSMMTASLMFVPQQLNGLLQGLKGYAPQAPSALTQLFWAAAAVPKEDEQMLMTEEGMPLLLSEVAWNQFLQQLNGPAAADVLQQISQFLQDFPMPPDVTLEKQGEVVQQTISKLRPTIRSHPAWKDNLPTFNADILVVDCLERYITEHLHDKLFLATEEAVAQDEALHDKIFRLQFLRPRHLSLPRSYDDVGLWDSAKEELFMMNSKRTPQEKLACLLRCSKGVLSVLRTFCSKNDLPGADDFLPALIFLILRANPPFLHSNMKSVFLLALSSSFFTVSCLSFSCYCLLIVLFILVKIYSALPAFLSHAF